MRTVANQTRGYAKSPDETISSLSTALAKGLDDFADSIEEHGMHINAAILHGGMDTLTDATLSLGDFCP